MKTRTDLRWKRPLPHVPPLSLDEEEGLLRQVRAGDAAASEALVRAFYPEVHRVACQLAGNPEDGADLAQDCFVRAWRGLAGYRGGQGRFRGWLRSIVVHLARDRFRTRARRPATLDVPADVASRPGSAPWEAADRSELRSRVERAIQGLPQHLRVPLVLRAIEGWSYDDVAAATGVTPATARTQVMKARRRLHQTIGALLEQRRGDDA